MSKKPTNMKRGYYQLELCHPHLIYRFGSCLGRKKSDFMNYSLKVNSTNIIFKSFPSSVVVDHLFNVTQRNTEPDTQLVKDFYGCVVTNGSRPIYSS